MENELRKEVKLLKALQGIQYQEISDYLEIKRSSFYSWLRGNYSLGVERQNKLLEIIQFLKE